MGLPLPGEAALVAAGVLAHQGQLSIGVVIALGAGAAIAGDNLGYLLGAKGGRRLLERAGRFARWRRRFLAEGERFFARHGSKAVFLARFVAGARVTAAWLAGANRMPWRRFLIWNTLGGACWATLAALVGFVSGAVGERIAGAVGAAGVGLALTAATVAVAIAARRRRRRSR
jgi:membrane protein DedA with SNARE-associated domain